MYAATSSQVSGQITAADYKAPTPDTLTTAIGDMVAAYNTAAGRASDYTDEGAGILGGRTFLPGVHTFSTGVTIASDIFLSGTCNDVFIFQVS